MSRKDFSLLTSSLEAKGSPFDADGHLSRENTDELYARIRHLLTDEHIKYLESIKNGTGEIDPLIELEMLMRQASVYTTQVVQWALDERKFTRDVPPAIGEVRQIGTAIENMRSKRKEVIVEHDEEGQLVDPTRKSPLDRFQDLHRGDS